MPLDCTITTNMDERTSRFNLRSAWEVLSSIRCDPILIPRGYTIVPLNHWTSALTSQLKDSSYKAKWQAWFDLNNNENLRRASTTFTSCFRWLQRDSIARLNDRRKWSKLSSTTVCSWSQLWSRLAPLQHDLISVWITHGIDETAIQQYFQKEVYHTSTSFWTTWLPFVIQKTDWRNYSMLFLLKLLLSLSRHDSSLP